MSDVAIFSVSEYPVQHPRRAEQSNVAAVKRREWPASNVPLPGKKDSTRLAIGCGIEHQILDLIQGNARVREYSWSRRRDFVARFWSLSQDRKVGFQSQHLQPAHRLLQRMVAHILVPLSPFAKNSNLFVPDSLTFSESMDTQVDEVLTQRSGTGFQLRLWNDKNEDTAGLQPAIGMLQKDKFQPLIVGLPNFQVIGRVEIEQGDRFGRAANVHDVPVHDFDPEFFGLLCSVGVNLDPVSTSLRFFEHVCKRHSVSNAGVNR